MALSLDQVKKQGKARAKNKNKSASSRTTTVMTTTAAKAERTTQKGRASAKKKSAPSASTDTAAAMSALASEAEAKAKSAASSSSTRPQSRPQLRPWSQRGLAKAGQSRKDRIGTDHHMNEDWINLHETPLFWVDIASESRLAFLQEKLEMLERKATNLAKIPCTFLSRARMRFKMIWS